MRRPKKASSAGSTSGQASRLGSFFGAFAVRGASSGAGGSGAPSPARKGGAERRGRFGLACLSVLALGALLGGSALTSTAAAAGPCPNAAFRTGPSASLPDCRAFELVTPPDTNGVQPYSGVGSLDFPTQLGPRFNSPLTNAAGDSYMFTTIARPLPGTDAPGYGNQYRAQRQSTGWSTSLDGPTAIQAGFDEPGGFSADHGYWSFRVTYWDGRYSGTLAINLPPHASHWIRYPDGTMHLVGEGTIPAAPDNDGFPDGFADDISARPDWISPDGSHIILATGVVGLDAPGPAIALTPDAPTDGSVAIYDRTPGGLHLLSLLPGNDTPTGDSDFEGASRDGSVVMFLNGSTLYARVGNTTTETVATGNPTPAGLSDVGSKAFYAQGGNLFSFDTGTQITSQINSSADATFVQPSADGSDVYFVSPSQLDGTNGTLGARNLYDWDGVTTTYVATLDASDFDRIKFCSASCQHFGLDSWTRSGLDFPNPAKNDEISNQTSRVTPDGSRIVFESKAQLTSYDNAGHFELYLYDGGDQSLVCVSCSPVGDPPTSDARLLDHDNRVVGSSSDVHNLSDDGQKVFFEALDALLPQDSNGVADVYEWHAGQLSLISSGKNVLPSVLTGVNPDGSDVFFSTTDRLVAGGQEAGAPGIYDARVNGGFPAPASGPAPCLGDTCQGPLSGPLEANAVGSSLFGGAGNVNEGTRSTISGLRKLSSSDRSNLAKGGKARLRLKVNRAGTVTLAGTARVGKKNRRVVRSSAKARKAGAVSIPFALSKSARTQLRSKRSLTVRLVVRFKDARPKVVRFTLKSATSKKGGRS